MKINVLLTTFLFLGSFNAVASSPKFNGAKKQKNKVSANLASAKYNKKNSYADKVTNANYKEASSLNSKLSAVKANEDEKKSSAFSLGVELSRSLQAETQDDGSRSEAMSYSLSPSFKSSSFSAALILGYSQDLKKSEESDWDDAEAKFGLYSTEALNIWKLSLGASTVIPLSKSSREVRELKFSVSPNASLALDSKKIGAENTLFVLVTSVARNFHNATTDAVKGDSLTQYSWAKGVVTGYTVPMKMPLAFKFTFLHYSNFSYENVAREAFVHEEKISLNFTDAFSWTLAHFNKAPMYKAPTYEYNLKALDKSSSYYYTSIGYDF